MTTLFNQRMNFNEFFFFKTIPCSRNNEKHDMDVCYFCHKDNNDMRRLLLDFHDVGGFLPNLLHDEYLETDLDVKIDKRTLKLKYYNNEIGFESDVLNSIIFNGADISKKLAFPCKNFYEHKYHILNYKESQCYFEKNFNSNVACPYGGLCAGYHSMEDTLSEDLQNFKKFYETLLNPNVPSISKSLLIEFYIKLYNSENSFANTKKYMVNLEEVFILKEKERERLKQGLSQAKVKIPQRPQSSIKVKSLTTLANNLLKSKIQNELRNIPVLSKGDNYINFINTDNQIIFLSNTLPKKEELNKLLIAFLNSHSGIIIYGADINTNKLTGVKMDRKSRDYFRQTFNTEYKDYLIEYEGCIKYKFFDLEDTLNVSTNPNNSSFLSATSSNLCIIVIKIKKIKDHKLIFDPYNKPFIIKEKFLKKFNANKEEKIKINDIKQLNMKEYVEFTKNKIIKYYQNS